MSIARRLARIESILPRVPSADQAAAASAELDRLTDAAARAVWQTIPREFQTMLDDDFASFASNPEHKLSWLALAFRERVRELAKGSILPQSLPREVCQWHLENERFALILDCGGCGYQLPSAMVDEGATLRYVHTFRDKLCPLCGGRIGWHAFHQATGFVASTQNLYSGRFQRWADLCRAAGRW